MRNFFICLNLISVLMVSGCAGIIIQSAKPMLIDQQVSLSGESNLDIAKTALESNIKLIEGLTLSVPNDTDLKLWLCEALCGYTLGFVEDTNRDQASALYLRARNCAIDSAKIRAGFDSSYLNDLDKLKKWIDSRKKANIRELFWLGQSWGSWVSINLDNPEALADLTKVKWIMEKVAELDETFYHAGADIFLGSVYGTLSPMLGGNAEKSKSYFGKSFQITENKFMLAKFYYAKTYCVTYRDKPEFDKTASEIEQFDINTAPSLKLFNAIAEKKLSGIKEKAEELLSDE